MTQKADIKSEADRLRGLIEARGAEVVETDVLQPAEVLLDLYGEDIRARAFVTQDPLRGEMMLRPDFTVPLVQRHMSDARDTARYTYAGEVFRRQEDDLDRPTEFLQVGYEVFGGTPADADAEVFACFRELLAPRQLRMAMGDIGLISAAVEGLATSDARKNALKRHLWRPFRFRALMTRFSAPSSDIPDAIGPATQVGLRTATEVEDRLTRLREDQKTPPISAEEIALIDALLDIKGPATRALATLSDIAKDMPTIADAVRVLTTRFDALDAAGVPVEATEFEASYGRNTLEYYDGMVFGFYIDGRDDLPPVATGGRYDALTRALGGSTGVPAVGGVIRPALLAEVA